MIAESLVHYCDEAGLKCVLLLQWSCLNTPAWGCRSVFVNSQSDFIDNATKQRLRYFPIPRTFTVCSFVLFLSQFRIAKLVINKCGGACLSLFCCTTRPLVCNALQDLCVFSTCMFCVLCFTFGAKGSWRLWVLLSERADSTLQKTVHLVHTKASSCQRWPCFLC